MNVTEVDMVIAAAAMALWSAAFFDLLVDIGQAIREVATAIRECEMESADEKLGGDQ